MMGMKTAAAFMVLTALALCHCWIPPGQDNTEKREEKINLSRRNGNRDAVGFVRYERRNPECPCERPRPQYIQRRKRHMKAPRSQPAHGRRCFHACRDKQRHKHRVHGKLSIPLS
ncbi:uncharacterized protein WCC33_012386 [Rhinophrynus dorsalis]